MARYLLAHDLGTTGNKATLFSEDGTLVASRTAPYGAHYFNDIWVEQDADDWWDAVCKSSKSLIAEAGIDNGDIAAVSFSGQMMGCLCVDREGKPLRPSIIWADQRSVKQAAMLQEHISQEDFYKIVGHINTPSYGVQKLMWIKENQPEIYEQTYKTLNAKDYIVLKLTGKFYTDYSDANSVACFDINKLQWSEELISYAGIDGDKLPEAKPSTFVAGGVTKEAAIATGLKEGTPVVMGCGDGVAASVGCGSVYPGKTYSCMGTSAWITTASEKPIFDPSMRTVNWAHAVPGLIAPNGTMQYAGGSYNWLKSTICKFEQLKADDNNTTPYKYMDEEAAGSPCGSNGMFFLPYLLGERSPWWDADAKGCWIGMKPETTRGDMIRSVMEGVAMNLAVCLDALRAQMDITELMVVGGGARSKVWQQIMADVYDAKIVVPAVIEGGSSLGAAVIAGVGTGIFKDFSVIDKFIEVKDVINPNPDNTAVYNGIRGKFEACYFALKDVFKM